MPHIFGIDDYERALGDEELERRFGLLTLRGHDRDTGRLTDLADTEVVVIR